MTVTTTYEFENCKTAPPFYVVSPVKLLLLTIFTFGCYNVFWLYQNWKAYSKYNEKKISPLFRSIFAPFFIYDLLKSAREHGDGKAISDMAVVIVSMAYIILFFIVGFSLVPNPMGHLIISFHFSYLNGTGLLLIGLMFWIQWRLNIICGDEFGKSNDKLSIENFVWIGFMWVAFTSAFIWSGANKEEAAKWGLTTNFTVTKD